MHANTTALERAFELAKSGRFSSVGQVRKQVDYEGYDGRQLSGATLHRQLRQLLSKSNGNEQQLVGD